MKDIRVTVRGAFDGLTDDQRAALLAAAPEHDFLTVTWSRAGHMSYDIAARPFFAFRVLESAAGDAEIPAAAARGEAAARAWLTARGYAGKDLTAQAVDMTAIPLGRRGRREAERRAG